MSESNSLSAENMRAYLLGQLPLEDSREIANRAALDASVAAQVEIAESLLMEDRVHHRLTAVETEAFHREFLTTQERRDRFAITTGMVNLAAKSRSQRLVLASLAATALMLVGLWHWNERNSQPQHFDLLPQQSSRSAPAQLISLSEINSVLILTLNLPGSPPKLNLKLGKLESPVPILQAEFHRQNGTSVEIPISKRFLAPGDYAVIVSSPGEYRRDFRFTVVD